MPGEWINIIATVADPAVAAYPQQYQVIRFMPGITVTPNATTETFDVKIDDVLTSPIVENLEELAALSDTEFEDYRLVFVKTLLDWFMLIPQPKAIDETVDPVVVIFTQDEQKRWVRQERPNKVWAARTSYYVDNLAGNDEFDGTIDHPIRTISEILRRVGKLPFANFWITVYLQGDSYAAESYIVIDIEQTSELVFRGGLLGSPSFSGTISAVQTPDSSVPQEWQITVDDSGATFDESGSMILITDGPNVGSASWVARDLTGGVARTCGYRTATDYGGIFFLGESFVQVDDPYSCYTSDHLFSFQSDIYVTSGVLQCYLVAFTGYIYQYASAQGSVDLCQCYAANSVDFTSWNQSFSPMVQDHDSTRGKDAHRFESGVLRGIIVSGGRPVQFWDVTLDASSTPDLFGFLQLRNDQRLLVYSSEAGGMAGFAVYVPGSVGVDIHPGCSVLSSARVYGEALTGDGIWVHGSSYFGIAGTNYPKMAHAGGNNVMHFGEGSDRTDGTVVPHEDPAGSGARCIVSVY